jgi:hypothetical protein
VVYLASFRLFKTLDGTQLWNTSDKAARPATLRRGGSSESGRDPCGDCRSCSSALMPALPGRSRPCRGIRSGKWSNSTQRSSTPSRTCPPKHQRRRVEPSGHAVSRRLDLTRNPRRATPRPSTPRPPAESSAAGTAARAGRSWGSTSAFHAACRPEGRRSAEVIGAFLAAALLSSAASSPRAPVVQAGAWTSQDRATASSSSSGRPVKSLTLYAGSDLGGVFKARRWRVLDGDHIDIASDVESLAVDSNLPATSPPATNSPSVTTIGVTTAAPAS